MEEKQHPTHSKTTSIILFGTALTAMGFGFLGWYSQENIHSLTIDMIALLGFIVCFLFFVLSSVLLTNICRCPNCKKFLFNWNYSEIGKGKKYTCKDCEIIWDSKVVVDETG